LIIAYFVGRFAYSCFKDGDIDIWPIAAITAFLLVILGVLIFVDGLETLLNPEYFVVEHLFDD